jgi:hypothetical protein
MAIDARIFSLLMIAVACFTASIGCSSPTATQKESPAKFESAPQSPAISQSPGNSQSAGRYQLVTMGTGASTFLIDTSNGCVWHLVQNEKTKRPTFIEADVENLHWGWGSGAQQILAAQIEALNKEEQKIILKQKLQKTECGQFNVTLSPDGSRKSDQVPEAKPQGPEK